MKRTIYFLFFIVTMAYSVFLWIQLRSNAPDEMPFVGDRCYFPHKPVVLDEFGNAFYVNNDLGYIYKSYRLGFAERLDKIVNWHWDMGNPYGCFEGRASSIVGISEMGDGSFRFQGQKEPSNPKDYRSLPYELKGDSLYQLNGIDEGALQGSLAFFKAQLALGK